MEALPLQAFLLRGEVPPFRSVFPAFAARSSRVQYNGKSGRSCSPSLTYVISCRDSGHRQSAVSATGSACARFPATRSEAGRFSDREKPEPGSGPILRRCSCAGLVSCVPSFDSSRFDGLHDPPARELAGTRLIRQSRDGLVLHRASPSGASYPPLPAGRCLASGGRSPHCSGGIPAGVVRGPRAGPADYRGAGFARRRGGERSGARDRHSGP